MRRHFITPFFFVLIIFVVLEALVFSAPASEMPTTRKGTPAPASEAHTERGSLPLIQITQGEQVTLTLKLVNIGETVLNNIEVEFVAPPAWIHLTRQSPSVNLPAKSARESRPTVRLPLTFTVDKNAPLELSAPLVLKIFSSTPDANAKLSWTHKIQLSVAPRPLPESFALLQNYPNPFNPETWIPYQLPTAADVAIDIYDVSGRLVRHLDVGFQEAGFYLKRESAAYWDGRNNTGERIASGLYFYHLQADNASAIRRLLILK